MAWRRSSDKPLSGPMMVSLPTHKHHSTRFFFFLNKFCTRNGAYYGQYYNTRAMLNMLNAEIPSAA